MDYHGDGCEHHAKHEDRETLDCLQEIKKLFEAKLALPPLEEMRMTFLGKNCHPWRNFDFERPGEKMYSSSSPEIFSLAKDGSLKNLRKLISKDGFGSALVKTKDGQTVLHFAAGGGYTRVCSFLICDPQFDVNIKDSMGRTPLHEAASGSHLNTLRKLIYYGAKLNARTSTGMTALHFAVEEGNLHVISYLISRGIDVNATSDFGTPLWIAAIQNQQVAMQKLLSFNANPNIYPDGMLSPLHASILNRSPECVSALLSAGADINIRSCGVSPLEAAIKCGDKVIVELLLNEGAILNVMDDNGLTPLEFAAVERSHEMVRKLFRMATNIPTIHDWSVSGVITHCESEEIGKRIRRKAEEVYSLYKSVGQKAYEAGKYHTSFVWYTKEAAARLEEIQNYNDSKLNLPYFEEIRMLIRAKMAVFRSSNLNPEIPDRCTAEMILDAVGDGDIKKLRRLISKLGSKRVNLLLNVKSVFGETILHYAAGTGRTHICKYILLKLKFDINIKDYRGCTPLHTAAIANKTKTISYLIDSDADLNAMTFMGQTVLHLAVEAGSLDVIRHLISTGFDVNVATDFGTPLCSAAIHNQEKAMRTLLSNGAKPNKFPEGTSSPLCEAIVNQSYNCITQLFSAGADPNIKSFEVSPLETAIIYGDIKIVELLFDQGANTNEKGVYGLMPLELAVLEGDKEMVEMLFLKTPPIPNIKDWSVNGVRKHYEDKKAREQVRLTWKSAYSLFNSKGQEAYKAGRYQEAYAWYTEAIDTNECDQACVYLKRSLCLLQLNQNNSAVDDALMCLYLEGESLESAAAMCACGLAMVLCKEFKRGPQNIEEACHKLQSDLDATRDVQSVAPHVDFS